MYTHRVSRATALALALSWVSSIGFADSLPSLLDEAMQANPRLQAAERQWHAAQQRIRSAGGLEDPMIGATFERADTRMSDYMDIEYMVSQRLPAWGQRSARVKAAQLDAEAAAYRYLEAGRELRTALTEAAWNLWLADQRVATLREMAQLSADLADSVRARYESGQAMSADLTRSQIERAKQSNEVATLERERSVALATLNAQLNASPDAPREVSDLAPPTEPLDDLAQLLANARERNCRLLARDREIQARAAATRAARRDRAPMIELSVAARQLEGRSEIEAIDTGIAMNLPWIWGGKYKGSIASAEAERQWAEAERQEELRAIEQEVTEWHAQAENASRTAALLRETVVPLARQAVEQTQAAYTAGTGSLLDRIEAQRTLLESEFDLHAAIANQARARARLDQLAGPLRDWEQSTGVLPSTDNR
ncbi:MAG: TolC family protein [Kiritimatiellae bacterium]|nr:TolC family protein [Kiritimatiellia bacterium]